MNNLLDKIRISFNHRRLPSLPPSFPPRLSVNVFTGRWSRWWILKQITLIIVFHNCQLWEGCQCAQKLFVCRYVLHTHLPPPPQSPEMCLLSPAPNYSIRRTHLQMTSLLQLIGGTWLRKLFFLYIETHTSGSVTYCNFCLTEILCRWWTEKPTDCQPYWDTRGHVSVCVGVCVCPSHVHSQTQKHMHSHKQTRSPNHSVRLTSGFAKSLINDFNWLQRCVR